MSCGSSNTFCETFGVAVAAPGGHAGAPRRRVRAAVRALSWSFRLAVFEVTSFCQQERFAHSRKGRCLFPREVAVHPPRAAYVRRGVLASRRDRAQICRPGASAPASVDPRSRRGGRSSRHAFLKTLSRLDSVGGLRGGVRVPPRFPPHRPWARPGRFERGRHHERSTRRVSQQDGQGRPGLGAAPPELEKGVPERQPAGPERAVQGDLARRHALVAGCRTQPIRLRVRHLGPVLGSAGAHRHPPAACRRCAPGGSRSAAIPSFSTTSPPSTAGCARTTPGSRRCVSPTCTRRAGPGPART